MHQADIRILSGVCDHPKTILLLRRCGERAFRDLIRFWCWVRNHRPDGSLRGLSPDFIEAAAGWTGEPGLFFSSMIEVGYIDECGPKVHDWKTHQPWSCGAKERSRVASENAKKRFSKKPASDASFSDADGKPPANGSQANGKPSVSRPYAPPPSPTSKETTPPPPPSGGDGGKAQDDLFGQPPAAPPAKIEPKDNPVIHIELFPAAFQESEAFVAAWSRWVSHRKEKGSALHRLKTGAKESIQKLIPLGVDKAIAAIDLSVEKGWTGLFPDKVIALPSAANRSGERKSPSQIMREHREKLEREGTI